MIEANQTKSSFICYHWKPPSAYRNQLPFQKPSQIFGNKFSTSRPRWSVISYDSWASVLDWSHMGANSVFSFSVIGCFRKPQRFLRITSLVYQRHAKYAYLPSKTFNNYLLTPQQQDYVEEMK